MPPPNPPHPDANIQLYLALQEATLKIANLEENVQEIRELRKLGNKTERVLATYEGKLDNLAEKLAREVQSLQEAIEDAKAAAAASKTSCADQVKALETRMEKREKDAAGMRKFIITTIVGLVTSLIAAASAIVVAVIKSGG